MKKTILTIVTLLIVGFGATKASTSTNYNDSFTFIEGNISFAVFPNGEFDFYLNQPNNLQVNYNGPNVNISFNTGYNYNAYVQYDQFGAVVQIQNVPVFYDYYGRVTQIGSIQINYSNGMLVRLGGMNVYYNNYGAYAYHRGYINTYNRAYGYNPTPKYFAKPNYNYRVVSYQPYRKNYKETRYNYQNNHSQNKNYVAPSESRRAVTNTVPKRTNTQTPINYKKSTENVARTTSEQLSPNRNVVENKRTTTNSNSRNVQQNHSTVNIEEKTRTVATSERVNKRTM